MRFALSDDQSAFAEALADLLSARCRSDHLRATWEASGPGRGRVEGLWPAVVDMGVVGVLAPEGVGGLGLGEVDLAVLLREAGRVACPEPLTDVAMVAVPVIGDHAATGSMGESDAEVLLEGLCGGTSHVAVGLAWDADAAGRLLVSHAEGAERFLLEAADGLHLVDADVVTTEPAPATVDGSRALSVLTWSPSDATRLVDAPRAAAAARDRAALGTAAELCGLASQMVAMTVDYVRDRRQFGVPVGSFQAVKHAAADALLTADFALPLVWRAAASVAAGDPAASVHVSMAKAAASDAAQAVADTALQCHGAIGYTVEYDLHLLMKRAWALARRAGSSQHHRARVAAALRSGELTG